MKIRDLRLFGILKTTISAVAFCALVATSLILYKGHALDVESRQYVETAIVSIARNWREDELVSRATPELRRMFSPSRLDAFFVKLRQLGRLVKYEGSTGEAIMWFHTDAASYESSASYTAKARFENGDVTFHITLIKRDGVWLINEFGVTAAAPIKKDVNA